MQDFLELTVSAAASGCIYGLIALAYLLMIRPTGIINFAVGEWAMIAAFGGFLLLTKYEWPYPLGMAAVLAFMLVLGWVTERIAVRPLVEKGAPILAPILALLGMLVVFREAMQSLTYQGVMGAKGMRYQFREGKRTGFDPNGMVVRVYEGDRQGRVVHVGLGQ